MVERIPGARGAHPPERPRPSGSTELSKKLEHYRDVTKKVAKKTNLIRFPNTEGTFSKGGVDLDLTGKTSTVAENHIPKERFY